MAERILPHNDDAERSVLGACLLDKDALFDALELLTPDDFYSKINKEIFAAIVSLYKRGAAVDTLMVSDELQKSGTLAMVGGSAYIAALAADVPSTSNAGEYAKVVAERATKRMLIRAAAEIEDRGYSDKVGSEEVMDYAERSILDIGQKRQRKDYTLLNDVLMENIERLGKLAASDSNITGLATHFTDLDEKLSGLQKSDMVIVAARPSMGKTAFALNMAQQAAVKGGATVMIFSLEMAKEELSQRMLSSESRVELQKLKTGNLEHREWDQINMALDVLSDAKIYIDDSAVSLMEMKNKCRRLKIEQGLDLVVVDYLQLMSSNERTDSRQQEISSLSRGMKLMARELECPVIVLSQLSRAVEQREDKKPRLSDLRESGSIEQDADVVMFLYRDEYYNEETENPNTCTIIIAKHRNGETGKVELSWQGQYTKFGNKAYSALSERVKEDF